MVQHPPTSKDEEPISGDVDPSVYHESHGNLIETRYNTMIIDFYCTLWLYNVLAGAANWILLAGYIVIPGTFTSLQKSNTVKHGLSSNEAEKAVLKTIQNPPILGIGCSCLLVGLVGMTALCWNRRDNYVWLVDKMFIPTLLNSVAGLITTIINVYTACDGEWSIMAVLTGVATSTTGIVSLVLAIIYRLGKLERLKEEHIREINASFRMAT